MSQAQWHMPSISAVAGRSLSSWPGWSTEQILGEPGVHTRRNPASKSEKRKKINKAILTEL